MGHTTPFCAPSKIIHHGDTEETEFCFLRSFLGDLRASVVDSHPYGWAADPCDTSKDPPTVPGRGFTERELGEVRQLSPAAASPERRPPYNGVLSNQECPLLKSDQQLPSPIRTKSLAPLPGHDAVGFGSCCFGPSFTSLVSFRRRCWTTQIRSTLKPRAS